MALQAQWAYSFEDVTGSIVGPGGSFSIVDYGIANEGITITPDERVTITRGSAGDWMYNLRAAKGGRLTIRVLKNGLLNSFLSRMYNFDTLSSANVGQNLVSIRVPVIGDNWSMIGVAFTKLPTTTYAAEGPMMEWDSVAGIINGVIGNGTPGVSP